jgi:hypothetical protein
VLICSLPVNTLYIPSHVVDHECDTTVESFSVHSPNIVHRSRADYEGRASYVLKLPKVMPLTNDPQVKDRSLMPVLS